MTTADAATLLPAWVLHRREYRETSLLLECLCAERGRVGVVARGARSARSALKGLLQPFQPLWLGLGGRGELASLRTAEPRGRAPAIAGRTLASAFYVNELVMRGCRREDPQPELFAAYEAVLQQLGAQAQPAEVLRQFERRLLEALGYGLALEADSDGAPIDAAASYCFHAESGAQRQLPQARCSAGTRVSGSTLQALAGGTFPGEVERREARTLMRHCITHHFGNREFLSRRLFHDIAAGEA